MTKAELIAEITRGLPLSRTLTRAAAEDVITALDHVVARDLILGGYVPLPGIGVLEVKKRKARKGRNPRTGAEITIPACKIINLRVSGSLKDAVNQK